MRRIRTAAACLVLALCAVATAHAQGASRPASRTPHRTLGKTDCLSCHAVGANPHVVSVPATEHNFPNTMCTRCHRLGATMPSQSRHAFDAAHARCAVCHVEGNTVEAQPIPASHARYHGSTCVMCHEPQTPS